MRTSTSGKTEIYRVQGTEADWHVTVNDETGMGYASKEAAFEAAVAAASNAIRDGYEVVIVVPGAEGGESVLGVEDSGRPDWTALS